MLYYCVREPDETLDDTKLIIHRGGKDGPIMAVASPCSQQKYQTDIRFVHPPITIPFKHKHHSHFTSRDRSFHWKGHNELVEDDKDGAVAKFEPSLFEGNRTKIGVIDVNQVDIQDLVVVTLLVLQERDEEFKSQVKVPIFYCSHY